MKKESGIFNLMLNSEPSGLKFGLFNRARLWPKVFAGAGDMATFRNNHDNAERKVISEKTQPGTGPGNMHRRGRRNCNHARSFIDE